MAAKHNSPARRNSFTVAGRSKVHPSRRRRAYSIAPGDPLSPAAKARRSLAPRKSILKAAAITPDDADDATQSMDITRDYREDNPTRKSLGRRVSFANHAHVRLFEVPDHNTNSTASPQSSPAVESEPDTLRATNNENVYPGAQTSRRRSSARHPITFSEGAGEESMDMDSDDTGFSPSAFFRVEAGDQMKDVFNDADEPSGGDDMDVTEVIPRNIVRKRSLSFGGSRQPLATLSIPQSSIDAHNDDDPHNLSNEISYTGEDSAQSQSFTSEGDVSQPMEFTVPLIRPPQPPSDAWLALRSATHSGDAPYIPSSDNDGGDDGGDVQEMELTDAVSRLQAVRASLGLGEVAVGVGEESFTSTEDSFMDEDVGNGADGGQTVNVTQLMRRVSLGPSVDSTVTSVFSSQDQSREEVLDQVVPESPTPIPPTPSQEVYSENPELLPTTVALNEPQTLYPKIPTDDQPASSHSVPGRSVSSANRPPVFSTPSSTFPEARPVPSESSPQSAEKPPVTVTPTSNSRFPASPVRARSSSPIKAPLSAKKFTAAFAPPVTRPSPHRRSNESLESNQHAQANPTRRPGGTDRLSITPGRGTGAVRVPLSSSAISPFKVAPFHEEQHFGLQPSKRSLVGLRRPSGYFSQRRSLSSMVPDTTTTDEEATTRISPTKEAAATLGRKGFNVDGPEGRRFLEHPPSVDVMPGQSQRPDGEDDVQWRGEEEDGEGDTEGPRVSIEQFFEITGIQFMDDIAAPRRSIVPPSALRPSRRASTEAQIPLAEYVVAMAVNVPQLELYSHVSKDLQTWVERIKEIHKEAEEEAQKVTPPLFQEFVTTDESGQAELMHQLKLIKVHNHAQAKSEWYDWKVQWVEQLSQKAIEGFNSLEADAKILEGIMQQAQDVVPGLQQEYDELMTELSNEQAEVAELQECDQSYLNELKVTIAEQSAELDAFDADLKEAKMKFERLLEKLGEVESQKKEVISVVEDAERRIHIQKNSTRAEIFQLKDELEALESLHMWRVTKILPDLFEFTYASSYCVSIPCTKFRPVTADIQITRAENAKTKRKEGFPVLSALMLRAAHQLVAQNGNRGVRQVLQGLGDYWASCLQLQTQLKLVSVKFPLSIEETPTGFSAIATVLFASLKAKALISFVLDTPIFSSWPILIQSIQCNVKVAYGPIDRDVIQNAVAARLQQANPVNNHACLLDACMEAIECFA